MNNKGQIFIAWIVVFFILVITLFALIEPFKTNLDANRNYASGMNCPNTADFNQTAYNAQTTFEKLTYRPTCFATGLSMVWFVGAVLIFGIIWVYNNWSKR